MASVGFIPKDDAGKSLLLNNVAGKLPGYAATFGITPQETASQQADALAYAYALDALNQIKQFGQNFTGYKNLLRDGPDAGQLAPVPAAITLAAAPAPVKPGIFARLGRLSARIKNHPAYTDNIGQDLGIVGADQTFDPSAGKPVITALPDGGSITVGWTKGNFDGIEIQVDRGDGKGFIFLAVDTQPDYIDTLPLPATPAVWKYRAIYLVADDRAGQWSDEVKITVGG